MDIYVVTVFSHKAQQIEKIECREVHYKYDNDGRVQSIALEISDDCAKLIPWNRVKEIEINCINLNINQNNESEEN